MENEKEPDDTRPSPKPELIRQIFDDLEAKGNVVGLFDLLLKIDKRISPQNYQINQTG